MAFDSTNDVGGGTTGDQHGARSRLQADAASDSTHQQGPGLLKKLKDKVKQVGHQLGQEAKKVGTQLNHTATTLNKEAKEHHVVDKVKKAAVAAGAHGLLGPVGVVGAEAIKAAEKAKTHPQNTDNSHPKTTKTDARKSSSTVPQAHLTISDPYKILKYVPKL